MSGFLEAANAVCAAANGKVHTLTPVSGLASTATFAGQERSIAITTLAQLRALEPSAADASAYAEFLATTREQVTTLAAIRSAAQRGERHRVTVLSQEVNEQAAEGDQAAGSLGLTECAREEQPRG